MINLLPPEYKKELSKEEQFKIVLTLGIFVLLFLFCFSLILLSIEIYVSGQFEIGKQLIQRSQKEMKFLEIEDLEQKIFASTNSFKGFLKYSKYSKLKGGGVLVSTMKIPNIFKQP